METTNPEARLRLVREHLVSFEHYASATGLAPSEPLLAEFRLGLTEIEDEVNAGRASAFVHDLRPQLEAVTTRLSGRLDESEVPCLVVDATGYISDANAAVSRLLNVSARCLKGRALPLFVASERRRFTHWLHDLRLGGLVDSMVLLMRPRERRAKQVAVLGSVDHDGLITLMLCEVPTRG